MCQFANFSNIGRERNTSSDTTTSYLLKYGSLVISYGDEFRATGETNFEVRLSSSLGKTFNPSESLVSLLRWARSNWYHLLTHFYGIMYPWRSTDNSTYVKYSWFHREIVTVCEFLKIWRTVESCRRVKSRLSLVHWYGANWR